MKKPIKATIEDVVIEPDKVQPIIVNFQNGHLKDEETKKMKCGLFKDESKQKTILAMSNGQTVYKGYKPDLNRELTYTMFAIHNKKTGKVRLVQAERWDVAPVLDVHIDNDKDDNLDKTAQLLKQFGSKKAKRRTEQYEKMKVDVDHAKETLEKSVLNIEIDKSDLDPVSKDEFEEGLHIPVCNRDATTESNIYNIDDIVPKDILKTLYTEAVDVAEKNITDKPAFYCQTVEKLKDDPKSTVKIAILLYLEAVLNWLNMPLKNAKKVNVVVCPYSTEVNDHIIKTYSMSNGGVRHRPNSMRDKGIIHTIILGLMIWNFTLNLELFSSMFTTRIGLKKLLYIARWVNAVPLKNDTKSVTLKLPLPPPASKKPPRVVKKKSN